MLEELVVRDFALIDSVDVEFRRGLNVLSGETGAGKSILIGALSFLLGGKADADSIRTGTEEASVAGTMTLDDAPAEAIAWLSDRGVEGENGRILLRRSLRSSGRGSIYVQDKPVTRAELEELTGMLFDIHGQHEHQGLLKSETHRRYLDRYAGLEEEVRDFARLFQDLADKRNALAELAAAERDREQRVELLGFALEEIAAAAPKIGEGETLEAEARRLSDYEKLAQDVEGAAVLLYDQEESALPSIRKAMGLLQAASSVDGELESLSKRVVDLFYELEDAADQLRRYRDDLSYEPDRLEQVEERLQVLFKLKKKYGADEGAVLAYAESATEELSALERAGEDSRALERDIAGLEKDLARRAVKLSAERKDAAKELSEKVRGILTTLGMAAAVFEVAVRPKPQGTRSVTIGPHGADDVSFLISANPGEPPRDLVRIASGGELSRVMLALKTALAEADTVVTMVFDEIDAGIGGEVALAVGAHLKALAAKKQIFCITHLATIAARADNNMKVEKTTDGARARTTVGRLEGSALRKELARMLAGDSAGDAALAHADALLAKFGTRSATDG